MPDERSRQLAQSVLDMCHARDWSMHWTARGAYLQLEASELIEAVRGKRGDPISEAADVLIVLMSITQSNGIEWESVLAEAERIVEIQAALATTPCEHCGGTKEITPECTCYEPAHGHEIGCVFHGISDSDQMNAARHPFPCPVCSQEERAIR